MSYVANFIALTCWRNFLCIRLVLSLELSSPLLEFTPMEDFGNRSFVGLSHYFQIMQLWQILVLKGNSKLQQANYVKPNEVTQKHHEHTNTHKSDEASSS
jgi:hypothetical protein